MKRWRALGWDKKLLYLLTPGAPLAALLLPLMMNGWSLELLGWFLPALIAPGLLLGTANLLLVFAGRWPGKCRDTIHALMAVTLLPSLVLLGFELFLFLGAAVCYFFDVGPSPR